MTPLPNSCLAGSPFRLALPPEDALAHRSWEQARRSALAAIARGESFVVLGEPGTGKTLLLGVIGQALRAQGRATAALKPGEKLAARGPAEILLLDEADLLEDAALAELGRVPNPIVMAGLPGFSARLPHRLGPIRTATLERLGPEDVARFVRARLDNRFDAHPSFAPEAILALTRQSGGLFRLVAILAGAASFLAEQRGSAEVHEEDVNEAASLRVGGLEEPAPAPAAAPPAVEWELERHGLRRWRRSRAIAGWSGWFGASLAVVAVATVAAWGLGRYPAAQIGRGASPATAEAVLPEPPTRPTLHAAAPAPAPVAGRLRPKLASVPPPPEPDTAPMPLPTAAHSPEPERPTQAGLVFTGAIVNETMRQAGQLSLKMMTDAAGNPVGALFHASRGLIGTGMLYGRVGPGGKVHLAGRLLMGRNPFECELQATLVGDRLVGEATFVHVANGNQAHGRFVLSRL